MMSRFMILISLKGSGEMECWYSESCSLPDRRVETVLYCVFERKERWYRGLSDEKIDSKWRNHNNRELSTSPPLSEGKRKKSEKRVLAGGQQQLQSRSQLLSFRIVR